MARRIPLRGRKVVLTGASSGIGAAAARSLGAGGAAIALISRDREALEQVAAEARAAGATQTVVLTADVGDRDLLHATVDEAAERLGGIDVLIANAGAAHYGRFEETSPDDFDRTFAVIFGGVVAATRAALPHLERAQHGRVVATVSVLSSAPVPMLSAYVAGKHGVRGFLGSLRVELAAARSPVKVSMVHPGPVDSAFWRTMPSATGREPPLPPLAYSPEAVAQALVGCATSRRPPAEMSVGGLTAILHAGSSMLGRPVAERVLSFIWRTGATDAGPPAPPAEDAGLRAPVRRSDTKRGRHGGRRSLWAAVAGRR